MDINFLYNKFLQCSSVTTDSRNCPSGSLFIALKGENFNGNTFAGKALESGCAYAIVDEATAAIPGDNRFLLVENCLKALQLLAREHRRRWGKTVIGITGTNGKTTTKELMAAVLLQRYHLLYTQGNLNNHIGVPLTLLRLKPEHELAVIEMGASHPGDIQELVEIAEPNCGLITNVGKAHLQGFGSLEGVMKTKGELYDFLRRQPDSFIFLHQDNPYLQQMAQGLKQERYGSEENLSVSGQVTGNTPYLSFCWKQPEEEKVHDVHTHLIGEYNLSNALAAVAVGCHFGVDPDAIDKALEEYIPQNNRSQLQQTADNTLIIDAYNANPTSMRASIENFYRMESEYPKMLILGDMRELGADSPTEHQAIIELLQQHGFTDVILVGEQFAHTSHTFHSYPDATTLIEILKQEKPQGKVILIKGSNGIKLSSVIEYL
ncbi:MAG: UDP-N-acetylmuramoyl-tripeptide--D-alanyl-D-alanine ligase [Bacteroides sp.]|nr:UDP-N-acetylmuramoyl-tripeptide--D-alanyl-D-alanine ligase [Bacteroides sp.]MBO5014802.1 UDP-N-acetylmuramoyl-tripeptide--D-alanyl-D-alanine ligase [Bacteroidaceae bacterium]